MPAPESNAWNRARNRYLPVCVRVAFCTLFAAYSGSLLGCRPNKRYDTIEAELRTRERELAETRAALEQAQTLNRAYEHSRGHPAFPGAPAPVPTGPGPACPIRDIALARGTGGLDDDGLPGDEAFMVVIVPQDEDRSAVKVAGRATIAAWEITPAGIKNPIGTWELSADLLRQTWRSGIFATGYFVTLPWRSFPTTERVRVAARLTTTDGQAFEADRDITVRPAPQAFPRSVPIPGVVPDQPGVPYPSTPVTPPGREPLLPGKPPPGVPPEIPPGVEELPPPAGLQPGSRGAVLLPPVKQ
jgi:hypothetical protein